MYSRDKKKRIHTWALCRRKWETWLPGIQRRLRYITFLCWSSPASAPATALKSQKTKAGTENEKLPAVGKDQIQDHLRNLKVLKPLKHDEIYLWVLRKLAGEVAEPLSVMFQKSWESSEVCSHWLENGKYNLNFWKREITKTWWPTGQSVSPHCLAWSWSGSYWKLC